MVDWWPLRELLVLGMFVRFERRDTFHRGMVYGYYTVLSRLKKRVRVSLSLPLYALVVQRTRTTLFESVYEGSIPSRGTIKDPNSNPNKFILNHEQKVGLVFLTETVAQPHPVANGAVVQW